MSIPLIGKQGPTEKIPDPISSPSVHCSTIVPHGLAIFSQSLASAHILGFQRPPEEMPVCLSAAPELTQLLQHASLHCCPRKPFLFLSGVRSYQSSQASETFYTFQLPLRCIQADCEAEKILIYLLCTKPNTDNKNNLAYLTRLMLTEDMLHCILYFL